MPTMRSERRAAPSRRARTGRTGFTLFEVLAAVLILGLFYTVLIESAARGLRSEGLDRRRSAAAALADARLVELETVLALGAPLQPLYEEAETEDERFLLVTEIAAEDLAALLPPAPPDAPELQEGLQSLLVDERGESLVYRVTVAVRWDEAGEPQELLRQTWDFDRSQLATLFPPESGEGAAGSAGDEGDADDGDAGDDGDDGGSGGGQPSAGNRDCDAICRAVQTMEDLAECAKCAQ